MVGSSPCEDICINTDGAYECSCSDNSEIITEDGNCVGNELTSYNYIHIHNYIFVLLFSLLWCIDFNECTIPGLCQHICTNLIGGYYCSCQVGFDLVNGHNCTGNIIVAI